MRAILAGLAAGLLVIVVLAVGASVGSGGGGSTAGRVHTDAEVLCGACNG